MLTDNTALPVVEADSIVPCQSSRAVPLADRRYRPCSEGLSLAAVLGAAAELAAFENRQHDNRQFRQLRRTRSIQRPTAVSGNRNERAGKITYVSTYR